VCFRKRKKKKKRKERKSEKRRKEGRKKPFYDNFSNFFFWVRTFWNNAEIKGKKKKKDSLSLSLFSLLETASSYL
jgi:hypothetical protein